MENTQNTHEQHAKTLSAVCGLYCPACSAYIGTHEDPARLQWMSQHFGRPVEDMICYGRRAEKRFFHCEEGCTFVACAAEKGVEFCGECLEYPCDDLKTFQAAAPHRMDLWQNHQRIVEVGCQQWFQEKASRYTCPECGTLNSAYDLACRKCGKIPSCAYVNAHRPQIEKHLEKTR